MSVHKAEKLMTISTLIPKLYARMMMMMIKDYTYGDIILYTLHILSHFILKTTHEVGPRDGETEAWEDRENK